MSNWLSYICAIVVASALCIWGILSILSGPTPHVLAGTAFLGLGTAVFILIFYQAVEQIMNAGRDDSDIDDRDPY